MAEIQTVRVESEHFEGGIIINKDEFDEKVHTLYVESDSASGSGKQLAEGDDVSEEELMKLTKSELLVKASEKGIHLVPDDVTKKQIVDAITQA